MQEADPRRTATYRAAMAAVIILSTLLVLALIAVVAGFIRQARIYQADRNQDGQAAPPVITASSAASVMLAPGAHIVSAATASGKLILHVQTRGVGEVDIFDIGTGKLTAQIKDGPPFKDESK